MEILLQTYYILLPIVATALVGWVGVLLKDQKKKEADREDALRQREDEHERILKENSVGLMLVLRYMLQRYHAEYMLQGKISYTQYKNWIELYKAYEALDGNSIAEEWNDDIENMEKCDSVSDMPPYEKMLQNMNQRSDG